MMKSVLERWQLSEQELTTIVDENPSLRGFMLGYIAEYKLRAILTASDTAIKLEKPDDHARGKGNKNDMVLTYRERPFAFEVKSLQTNSIKTLPDGTLSGKAQVDASDNRQVTLPNGDKLNTTCLVVGEFDILAINLFQFREQWDFAFILNQDLPRSTYKKYTEEQRQYLLATLVSVTLPIKLPFSLSPFELMDRLIAQS